MKTQCNLMQVILLLSVMIPSVLFSATIRIGTGAGPAEALLLPLQKGYEAQTGNTLDIRYIGPDLSWKELDEGNIDIAFSGLTQTKWKQFMESQNITIPDYSQFIYLIVSKGRIRTIAHMRSVPDTLSSEQLKGVFTGKIVNWKELGGLDTPVKIVLAKAASGSNMLFGEALLDNAEISGNIIWLDTSRNAQDSIAKMPGAIGLMPEKGIEKEKVKTIEHKEILRPIALLVKGSSSPEINSLIQYLKTHSK